MLFSFFVRTRVFWQPSSTHSTSMTKRDRSPACSALLASEPPAMEAYRVSRAVNTPRNNREDLLLQVA